MTTTATPARTVDQTMEEIFGRCAFQASTPEEFATAIANVADEFSERPAVAAEWVRFVATKFAG